MAQAQQGARPHFSQPIRQILLMLIAIGLSGLGVFLALPYVLPVFFANPYLNGFILLVFIIGVFACFYQVRAADRLGPLDRGLCGRRGA